MERRITTIAPVVYGLGGSGASGTGTPTTPSGTPRAALPADGLLSVGYNGVLTEDIITLGLEAF